MSTSRWRAEDRAASPRSAACSCRGHVPVPTATSSFTKRLIEVRHECPSVHQPFYSSAHFSWPRVFLLPVRTESISQHRHPQTARTGGGCTRSVHFLGSCCPKCNIPSVPVSRCGLKAQLWVASEFCSSDITELGDHPGEEW